jgi:hypothetical protein
MDDYSNFVLAGKTFKLKMMNAETPRFEFRSFGHDFDAAAKRMARLSAPVPEKERVRTSNEIYIVSRTNDIHNTKIRDGKMDIKTLVQIVDGLEQWKPMLKSEFPVTADELKNKIFPAFGVQVPGLDQSTYTFDAFMDLIRAHPDLQAVTVQKQRFGYLVNNTICEVADVLINGTRLVTISTESAVIEDVKKTIQDIGLGGVENINYLQAIKRVMGMINKPLAN